MKSIRWPMLLACLLALPVQGGEQADTTLYVSHAARVPLRAQPDPSASITGYLAAGDAVTVTGRQAGFASVAAGNQTGWVLATDLASTAPPRLAASQLQSRLDRLEAEQAARITELEDANATLQRQLRTAQANARTAQSSLQETSSEQTAELNDSRARIDQLQSENAELRQALQDSEEQISTLRLAKEANAMLQRVPTRARQASSDWSSLPWWWLPMLAGGFLVVGLLAGIGWRNRQLRKRYHGMEL